MTHESEQTRLIDRREAIRRVSALLGGVALVGEGALLAGCRPDRAPGGQTGAHFSTDEIAFLDEVADTILPETSTPGAKAAKVGAFMAVMVVDTYEPRDQQVFRDGMKQLDEACRSMHGASFMKATPPQRLALLERLDQEQKASMDAREAARGTSTSEDADTPAHYFRMMKELTLLGYFTSEIGYTRAMRYAESPGRFDPCVPYTAGEPAWAPHA
jgi:glucoside 3-dehydrogenase (cytochrome c) hitch-hiker subunit